MTIKQYFNAYFFDIIFKHYGDCKGRAGRKLFFLFTLNCGIIVGLSLSISPAIGSIVALLLLLPFMAIIVRRLQDINFNGWWILLLLCQFINVFFLIFLFCIPGTKGENKYGLPLFVLDCKKEKDVEVDSAKKEDNKKMIDSVLIAIAASISVFKLLHACGVL